MITTALTARYCIQGGMELSTAYGLSDFYIQKADRCKNVEDLAALHPDMCIDYAKNMKKDGDNLVFFNTTVYVQNKEFKYHLNLADYYRKLLLAELTKDQNPQAYEILLNNKPNPEVGLQIMESVTVESINQSNQEHQSEIAKDASNLAGKIAGIISSVGGAISETAEKYGVNQKISEVKNKIEEEAKKFGESHPTINNAANTTLEAIKSAGQIVSEAANKIMNSEAVKNATQAVNEKYNEVMNSETVKNLSKKAEENYISLKAKSYRKIRK